MICVDLDLSDTDSSVYRLLDDDLKSKAAILVVNFDLFCQLTSLFPIVDLEMMARTPVQTNRRFRDDG